MEPVRKKPRLTPALEAAEAWALQKAHIDEEVRLAEEEVRRAEAGVLDKKLILVSHQLYQKLAARAVAEGLPADVSVEDTIIHTMIDIHQLHPVLQLLQRGEVNGSETEEPHERFFDLLGTRCSQLGYAPRRAGPVVPCYSDCSSHIFSTTWHFEKKASDKIVSAPSFH